MSSREAEPERPPMSNVLTQAEVQRLVLATVTGGTNVGRPPTAEQIERVVKWASDVRVDSALLHLVLDGSALLFDVGALET